MSARTLIRYLGDGVYASFDGYQIWLAVNHHENKVVALEPDVFRALVGYAHDISTIERQSISNEGGTTDGSHEQHVQR